MEKTKFVMCLGDSPIIRILDYMITCRELECSLSDIARNAEVGWTTLHRIFDKLLATGVVKYTRNIGMAKLFKLNSESKLSKKLVELHEFILDLEMPKKVAVSIKTRY